MRQRLSVVLVLSAFGVTGFLVAAPAASAHAYLIDSTPKAGEQVGTTPGVVVLLFSEPVDPALSSAVVTSPDGARVPSSASGRRMEIPLSTNAPGVYRVEWKVVDEEDGHTVRGSYRFGVGVTAEPGTGGSLDSQGLLLSFGRAVEYAALLFAAGALLLGALARRSTGLQWLQGVGRRRTRIALGTAIIAALSVVVGEAAAARGTLSLISVGEYLGSGLPGGARLARLWLEALAFASGSAGPIGLTALLLGGAMVALAASGHAAALHPVWAGVAVDAGHLIAAGIWAGGILALATVRPPGGWRGPQARELLMRFSPVAIGAFLATVAFGAVQGLQELGTIHAVWTTSYGKTLLVKVMAVMAMVPLSVLAWRRRVAPRGEAALGVVVVLAAALLSVLPVPAGGRPFNVDRGTTAFPRPGDLTLGGHAGQFLVGITFHPARSGPNTLMAYVLPVEGRVAGVPVEIVRGDRSIQMTPCGATCRSARIDLRGGETLAIVVSGRKGGRAVFSVPELPAPSGEALLARAQRTMHGLRTYRLAETLSSGLGPPIPSDYAFQAPHRMEITSRGAQTTRSVLIGGTRYLKRGGSKWQVQRGGPGVRVPSFIWDYFRPFTAPNVVGEARLAGIPTTIVSFFGRQGPTPVWFRVWVDGGGLVREAQMRAEGHFMDHHYFDFNAPIHIDPPVGTGG